MTQHGGSYTLNHETDTLERHEPLPKASAIKEAPKAADAAPSVPTISHTSKAPRFGKPVAHDDSTT